MPKSMRARKRNASYVRRPSRTRVQILEIGGSAIDANVVAIALIIWWSRDSKYGSAPPRPLKPNTKLSKAATRPSSKRRPLALTDVQTTLFCKRAPKGTVCFNLAVLRSFAGVLRNSSLAYAIARESTKTTMWDYGLPGAGACLTNKPPGSGASADRSTAPRSCPTGDDCGVNDRRASEDLC